MLFLRLTASIVCLLVLPVAAAARQTPDQRVTAALERAIASDALPDDPDLDWPALTSWLDRLIATSPGDPLAILAQRAAFRLRVSGGSMVVPKPGNTKRASLITERRLNLARAWAFRADVFMSVDGGSWTGIGSFSGRPGCSAWTPLLPETPGVHRVDLRTDVTFFDASAAQLDCAGELVQVPGPDKVPANALDPDAGPVWRETHSDHVSYAFSGNTERRGRLPDDYFRAARQVNVAALEPGLPDLSFDRWLRVATQPSARGPVEWHADPCTFEEYPRGDRAICVQALVPLKGESESRLIVRLEVGEVTKEGEWRIRAPALRTAFLTTNDDSLDIPRLADVSFALSVPANAWPVPDIEIDSRDITYTMAPAVPGRPAGPLDIAAVVRNVGEREAPGAQIRLFLDCLGPTGRASGATGAAGATDDRRHVMKEVVRDIPANDRVALSWSVASPCQAPWIVVHVIWLAPQDDPWKARRFEDRMENNFAGVRVGTAERLR